MFDSGASSHMTRDLNLIEDIKHIFPTSVGLPKGVLAFVSKEGSVTFGKRIKLNKVLHVLSLKCNIFSIARLCKELNCSATFLSIFVSYKTIL